MRRRAIRLAIALLLAVPGAAAAQQRYALVVEGASVEAGAPLVVIG